MSTSSVSLPGWLMPRPAGRAVEERRGGDPMGEIGTRWWRRATGAAVGAVVGTVALVLAAPAAGAIGNSFTLVSGASAPGSTLNATSAVSATDVWAGGAFRPTGAAYDDAGLDAWLEHFDGGSWTATAIPGVRHFDETVNG